MWVLGRGLGNTGEPGEHERTDIQAPKFGWLGRGSQALRTQLCQRQTGKGTAVTEAWSNCRQSSGGGKCLVGSSDGPEPSRIYLQGSSFSSSMAEHKLTVT